MLDAPSLARHVDLLNQAERRTPDEIAARQRERVTLLAQFHAEYTPHFARRLAAAKLAPEDLGDPVALRSLPPLTRRDIQIAGEDLFSTALPPDHGRVAKTQTSGSTGEPVIVRRTELNQLDLKAITMRDHVWHGRDFRWRFCAVRAHLSEVGRVPNWGSPAAQLHETGPSMGIPNWLGIDIQAREIAGFEAETLLIYPSNLAGLIDHLEREGLALPHIRDIRTIGETLPDELRQRCRDVFGVAPVDAYSSQELGYLALQCPDSGLYHVMAETMLVEIINDDGEPCRPGEIGRVIATDLRNWATPLVRYEIADYAEASEPCPCGRGLPTLKRIVGRTRNLVMRPDGTRHWPYLGFVKFREVAPIIQYQFIQHDPLDIEVRLLTERPMTFDEETALRNVILAALNYPFTIRFTYLSERIAPSKAGKFEEFICWVGA